MIEIFNKKYTKEIADNNKDKIYVFGDNDLRTGKGGQAIVRDSDNSIGIRTKKGPSKKSISYYNDDEYVDNCKKILKDILSVKSLLLNNNKIVLPKGGFGTGLSELPKRAPKTYNYLVSELKAHLNFDNNTGKRWKIVPGNDDFRKADYLKISFSNNIFLQPDTNSFFSKKLLNKKIFNYYDAIKTKNKIAFTSINKYKENKLILASFDNIKGYLALRVVSDSYNIVHIETNEWFNFEGFDNDYLNNIKKESNTDFYQTHFEYIGEVSNDGKILFRDDIFSSNI